MAKFQKINDFADRAMARMDVIGDAALHAMRNTPEAKAKQDAFRKRLAATERRSEARRQESISAATALAAALQIGQQVRTMRGHTGQIVAIQGRIVTLNIAGQVAKFSASTIKLV